MFDFPGVLRLNSSGFLLIARKKVGFLAKVDVGLVRNQEMRGIIKVSYL